MVRGILTLAMQSPWAAAGVGLVLGLLSSLSGTFVAQWTYLMGLRSEPAPGQGRSLGFAAVVAGVSYALAALVLDPAWQALGLALVWGAVTMDFAHNARAATVLRAVMETPGAAEHWAQFPLPARLAIARASTTAVLAVLAIAVLLDLDPAMIGFLLGVLLHLAWQRLAGNAALRTAAASAANE